MELKSFKQLPIMGILRDISVSDIESLLSAIIESGLKTIEITLNTDNACDLIGKAVKFSKNRLFIGAGTVLNADGLKQALRAGACFAVSPVLVEDVAQYCVKNKIPYFPGALTPTEIYRAWQKGAAMVKVFPASFFGPAYFKEIKGPFKEIELMAVGGVTAENAKQYLNNGADAIAFGGGIFKKDLIIKKEFAGIRESIRNIIKITIGR